jgi:hypothetical protein
LLIAASALLAAPSSAEPAGRDVGPGSGSVSVGPANATLGEAQPFEADPFALPVRTWMPPLPSAGNVPLPPFHGTAMPELTLALRPVLGFEPFLRVRTGLPFQAGSALDSDFGFRFRSGRFHAGARMSLLRDDRGIALDGHTYARYEAPKYNLGLADDAILPLGQGVTPYHRLTASAGLKPSAVAPAFRVSWSVRDAGIAPQATASMFGRF